MQGGHHLHKYATLHSKRFLEDIDYTEIFSPVVKMSTIRLVLGMVAAENLHLEQLDMKKHSFMVTWRKTFT